MRQHRNAVRTAGCQEVVTEHPMDGDPIRVEPERYFTFDPGNYLVSRQYEGGFPFARHYYRLIGELNGEELQCAWRLADRSRDKCVFVLATVESLGSIEREITLSTAG
jgi:hypothetical protein